MKHVLDKVKAPPAHQAFLEWLKDAVKEFGANCFPIAFLGSFSNLEMENRGKIFYLFIFYLFIYLFN